MSSSYQLGIFDLLVKRLSGRWDFSQGKAIFERCLSAFFGQGANTRVKTGGEERRQVENDKLRHTRPGCDLGVHVDIGRPFRQSGAEGKRGMVDTVYFLW